MNLYRKLFALKLILPFSSGVTIQWNALEFQIFNYFWSLLLFSYYFCFLTSLCSASSKYGGMHWVEVSFETGWNSCIVQVCECSGVWEAAGCCTLLWTRAFLFYVLWEIPFAVWKLGWGGWGGGRGCEDVIMHLSMLLFFPCGPWMQMHCRLVIFALFNQENQMQIQSNLWFSNADRIPFWKTHTSCSHAVEIGVEVFCLK